MPPTTQKELKKRLKTQMGKAENRICSDCSSPRPTWASILVPPPGSPSWSKPIGAFCCLECSGTHRRVGVHITFVRSINLDEWKEQDVLAMENGGNAVVNDIYEAKSECVVTQKPKHGVDAGLSREEYILNKYQKRLYFDSDRLSAHYRSKQKTEEDKLWSALYRSKNRNTQDEIVRKAAGEASTRFERGYSCDSEDSFARMVASRQPRIEDSSALETREIKRNNTTSQQVVDDETRVFSVSSNIDEEEKDLYDFESLQRSLEFANGLAKKLQKYSSNTPQTSCSSSSASSCHTSSSRTSSIADSELYLPFAEKPKTFEDEIAKKMSRRNDNRRSSSRCGVSQNRVSRRSSLGSTLVGNPPAYTTRRSSLDSTLNENMHNSMQSSSRASPGTRWGSPSPISRSNGNSNENDSSDYSYSISPTMPSHRSSSVTRTTRRRSSLGSTQLIVSPSTTCERRRSSIGNMQKNPSRSSPGGASPEESNQQSPSPTSESSIRKLRNKLMPSIQLRKSTQQSPSSKKSSLRRTYSLPKSTRRMSKERNLQKNFVGMDGPKCDDGVKCDNSRPISSGEKEDERINNDRQSMRNERRNSSREATNKRSSTNDKTVSSRKISGRKPIHEKVTTPPEEEIGNNRESEIGTNMKSESGNSTRNIMATHNICVRASNNNNKAQIEERENAIEAPDTTRQMKMKTFKEINKQRKMPFISGSERSIVATDDEYSSSEEEEEAETRRATTNEDMKKAIRLIANLSDDIKNGTLFPDNDWSKM